MIVKEKNKVRRPTLLDFMIYYKVTLTKTVWYWQKKRQIHQWNRNRIHQYSRLIYDKGANVVFSTNGAEQLDSHMPKKKKKNLDIRPCTLHKINSKWTTNLNAKCATKLLENNIGEIWIWWSLFYVWYQSCQP